MLFALVVEPRVHDRRDESIAGVVRPLDVADERRPAFAVLMRHEAADRVGHEARHGGSKLDAGDLRAGREQLQILRNRPAFRALLEMLGNPALRLLQRKLRGGGAVVEPEYVKTVA